MKKLHFSVIINAPVAKVWDTMLGDSTYREWTLAFNAAGSWYEGSWEQGSQIRFLGPNPETGEGVGGMLSEIAESRLYEFVSIRHKGMVENGVEITEGPKVEGWIPAYENYTFHAIDDHTTQVDVELDSHEEFASMFEDMWPKGLLKLKELTEK